MKHLTLTLATIACAIGLAMTGCARSDAAASATDEGVTASTGAPGAKADCADCAGCANKSQGADKSQCADKTDCEGKADCADGSCYPKGKDASVADADGAPRTAPADAAPASGST